MNEVSPYPALVPDAAWLPEDAAQIVPLHSSDPIVEGPFAPIPERSESPRDSRSMVWDSQKALDRDRPNREAADALVCDHDAPLGQEFLDITVAEREPEIEPHGVSNDLGWELMARVGDRMHRAALPRIAKTRPPSRDNAT